MINFRLNYHSFPRRTKRNSLDASSERWAWRYQFSISRL